MGSDASLVRQGGARNVCDGDNGEGQDPQGLETSLGEVLNRRYSCRAFTSDPVPRSTITAILEAAQRSPSWCNTQPWQVAIIEGDALSRFREGLLEYVVSHPQEPDIEFPVEYQGKYRTRRKECAVALYESVGVAGDRAASAAQTMQNFGLFGAPHVAVITTDDALGTYGAVDCGIFVSTFLLAASSFGVATIAQAALAGSSPYLRGFLELPEDRKILCAISFGYADEDHPVNNFRTTRVGVDDVVDWVTD
ncbi:MAG: nitroreductase [Rhodococcus sp.]|nr:nitroreductase [Rhodococcus sp. (in: high G+C Gram-positive bacteria)]